MSAVFDDVVEEAVDLLLVQPVGFEFDADLVLSFVEGVRDVFEEDQTRDDVLALGDAGCAEVVAAIARVCAAFADESRTLAGIRDTLLPRLMSGKLRVKYAEQQVGAVV